MWWSSDDARRCGQGTRVGRVLGPFCGLRRHFGCSGVRRARGRSCLPADGLCSCGDPGCKAAQTRHSGHTLDRMAAQLGVGCREPTACSRNRASQGGTRHAATPSFGFGSFVTDERRAPAGGRRAHVRRCRGALWRQVAKLGLVCRHGPGQYGHARAGGPHRPIWLDPGAVCGRRAVASPCAGPPPCGRRAALGQHGSGTPVRSSLARPGCCGSIEVSGRGTAPRWRPEGSAEGGFVPEFCGPSLLFGLRAYSRRAGVGRVLVSEDGARTWQARRPLEEVVP